jgi:hypothetical protein
MKSSDSIFNAGRMLMARSSLERLATECLSPATSAAYVLAGNNPEKVNFEEAGRIAVVLAITIRTEVSRCLEDLLTREDADSYLQRLALDLGKDLRAKEEGGS